eukprot:1384783-Amphidinium_carterae.1
MHMNSHSWSQKTPKAQRAICEQCRGCGGRGEKMAISNVTKSHKRADSSTMGYTAQKRTHP